MSNNQLITLVANTIMLAANLPALQPNNQNKPKPIIIPIIISSSDPKPKDEKSTRPSITLQF